MSDTLKSAGEVNIQRLEIVSSTGLNLDVRNLIQAINIYEDLFSPFITGTLVLTDAIDLVNLFPLIGDETLFLTISTPGFTKKGTFIDNTFKIFKMTDREFTGNRVVSYILHFISSEAVMDVNIKISKSFTDNIGNTVAKIFESYSLHGALVDPGRYNIEPTSNGVSYVSNFWSPIKNLNYLAEHALTLTNSPTYLFFENRNGLNFISLEGLYQTDSIREFVQDDYSRDFSNLNQSNIRNIEKDFSKIGEIHIPVAYDYINRSRSGTFASNLTTYNLTTKSYNSIGFDYLDEYDTDTRLNKYPLLTKSAMHSSAAAMATMSKASGVLTGGYDITNSKYFQRRRSLLALSEACKITISVLGRTDYTVGQKISLKLSQNKPIEKTDLHSDISDNMFSGFYIISAIRHTINREVHLCQFELIKDSSNIKL